MKKVIVLLFPLAIAGCKEEPKIAEPVVVERVIEKIVEKPVPVTELQPVDPNEIDARITDVQTEIKGLLDEVAAIEFRLATAIHNVCGDDSENP